MPLSVHLFRGWAATNLPSAGDPSSDRVGPDSGARVTAASRPIIAAIELSLFSREPFSPSQIKSRRFLRRRRSVVTHDLSLMAASPAGVSRETLAGNLCRPRQAAFTRCGGRRRDPSHDRIAQRSRATRRRDYRTS